MLDKALAVLAILSLILSVGVVIWFIPEPDLVVLSIVVISMAIFDFYLLVFRQQRSND